MIFQFREIILEKIVLFLDSKIRPTDILTCFLLRIKWSKKDYLHYNIKFLVFKHAVKASCTLESLMERCVITLARTLKHILNTSTQSLHIISTTIVTVLDRLVLSAGVTHFNVLVHHTHFSVSSASIQFSRKVG